MATSGRGSGTVGYNVQVLVETEHHLIVTHEVINIGNDRAQLAPMAKAAQQALGSEELHVLADRGYFDGEQIKACADAGLNRQLATGTDLGLQGPRPLRQTALRLSARPGRLSLPGRSCSALPLQQRRKGHGTPALLVNGRMPRLHDQEPMHHK